MKNNNWLYKVFLLTFILAILFSAITSMLTNNFSDVILFIILLVVICIGILFDMIGVAVLTSNEATFHSMAAKKINGAKESIALIKNSVKVSSVCNDVIGDICGIVSGGLAAVLTLSICDYFSFSFTVTSILVTSIVSSLTVGGKAIFKTVATKKCDQITTIVGKIVHFFKINKK